jgi:hypothetical protein
MLFVCRGLTVGFLKNKKFNSWRALHYAKHWWASASTQLTPASAFRHLLSRSGTGPKNAGLRRFIPVLDLFRYR